MCGITGIFNVNKAPVDTRLIAKMTETIRHRGPDGEGYLLADTGSGVYELAGGKDTPEQVWQNRYPFSPQQYIDKLTTADNTFNLAFGHRRLSIIDLSPAGHQPMCSHDSSLWIVYNGEIYNYLELRQELRDKGYNFITNTDTEVILHAYQEWGHDCLDRFNGMWAFAIWDRTRREIFCSRDRFGVKPFYYFFNGTTFAFASEIKALLQCSFLSRVPNDKTIYRYLAMGRSEGKKDTFFEGIQQLEPGHYLTMRENNGPEIKRYYNLAYNPEFGGFSEDKLQQYSKAFLELLSDAIRIRLRSDVPVGSCLSGGLDSSTIVCTINNLLKGMGFNKSVLGEHQKVFSSCYDNALFDERPFIDEVTSAADTDAHCVFPSGEKLWQELDNLIWHQEEPFGSTSIYAQWNVMRLAKQNNVTVLLDGQGGDELLGGYHSYFSIYLSNLLLTGRLSSFIKEFQNIRRITGSPYPFYSFLLPIFNLIPSSIKPLLRGRLFKAKQNSLLFNKAFLKKHRQESAGSVSINLQKALWESETGHGLRELLRYEDKNSMAFSLETRTPFIDYRLVDFVFSLPACYKIHDGWTKYLLRNSTGGLLPEKIRWRKDKMGFPTPEKIWFKENRKLIIDIFSSSHKGLSDIYLDRKNILNNLDTFLNDRNATGISTLWRPINLELWLKKMFH